MTIVTTQQGKIRGFEQDGQHIFKGVPYAAPLSGANRWLEPQPVEPWDGERPCTEFSARVEQSSSMPSITPFPNRRRKLLQAYDLEASTKGEGDDCLTLNIWTPTLGPDAKLPVMVWIHGGAWTLGSGTISTYDGRRFASHGVVLVTINYRLGVAGWMNIPGVNCNRGSLDQLAALRWVQDNIRQFGGDPDCVTIFGESAGGSSTYGLSASPMAKGLFQRSIPMSGVPILGTTSAEMDRKAEEALQAVGITSNYVENLARLDARGRLQLFKKYNVPPKSEHYPDMTSGGGPVSHCFESDLLPERPVKAYAKGTPNNVDMLLGTTREDGRLLSVVIPGPSRLASKLGVKMFAGSMPTSVKEMQARYQALMPNTKKAFVRDQLTGDALFRAPTWAAAESHAAGHPGRTWLYQMDYPSIVPKLGAIHGLDCALVFGNFAGGLLNDDEPTRLLSDQMQKAFVAFAKTGNPNHAGIPQWDAFNAEQRATMVFDSHTRQEDDYGQEFRALWVDQIAKWRS